MDDETLSRSSALGATTSAEALPAQEAAPDLVGRVLDGRFSVESRLGRGGMGAVYRATQKGVTEREVAIKVILPERVSGSDALARFEREARAAARLGHPNTLRIFEFGQTPDGIAYLVTELLAGRSLADELGRVGAMPVARALRIATQALASLSEAHEKGIVHRDLKPDNLFLADVVGAEDFVKVIDFGLATLPVGPDGERLTTDGQTVGTPAYMSPEQVHGQLVGPAGDLYSMGVILFEMVTGRRPFTGNTPFDTMRAHVMDPAPPLELPGGFVPHALREVVARCLEKKPEHRPESADALRRELSVILAAVTAEPAAAVVAGEPQANVASRELSTSTGTALRAAAPTRRRLTIASGVVAAGIAAGLAWGVVGRDSSPAPTGAGAPAKHSDAPQVAVQAPSATQVSAPPVEAVGAVRAPRILRAADEPDGVARHELTQYATVTVNSTPPGANVSVEGHPIGRTPAVAWVPEGATRRAVVRLAGHRTATVDLTGLDGAPVALKLRPMSGLDVKDFASDGDQRLLDRLTGANAPDSE